MMQQKDELKWARFLEDRSESAFSDVVSSHIHLVYSTALRALGGDAHLAKDLTQSVFIDLARKRPRISKDASLAGWLYRHARFTASKWVRSERRRKQRELKYEGMKDLTVEEGDREWEQMLPHLDRCLSKLSQSDREVLLLRFFKQKGLKDVGQQIGVSSDTARKRVSRAVNKLRILLCKQGVNLSMSALSSALATNGVTAAPLSWVPSITSLSLSSASAGTGLGVYLAHISNYVQTTKTQCILSGSLATVIAIPLVIQEFQLLEIQSEQQTARRAIRAMVSVPAAFQDWRRRQLEFARYRKLEKELVDKAELEGAIAFLRNKDAEKKLVQLTHLREVENELELAKQENENVTSKMEFKRHQIQVISDMKHLGLAARIHAVGNKGRLPTTYEALKKELPVEVYSLTEEKYEYVKQERRVSAGESEVILFREVEARSDGMSYFRAYCFCDGTVRIIENETNDYSEFEAEHSASLENVPQNLKDSPVSLGD